MPKRPGAGIRLHHQDVRGLRCEQGQPGRPPGVRFWDEPVRLRKSRLRRAGSRPGNRHLLLQRIGGVQIPGFRVPTKPESRVVSDGGGGREEQQFAARPQLPSSQLDQRSADSLPRTGQENLFGAAGHPGEVVLSLGTEVRTSSFALSRLSHTHLDLAGLGLLLLRDRHSEDSILEVCRDLVAIDGAGELEGPLEGPVETLVAMIVA